MPTAANAEAFDQPHWRVIAAGFDTERWFADGQAVGTGGIVNPQPTQLRSGHYYYRFAGSTSPREAQLGGGWWVDFENFSLIHRLRIPAGSHPGRGQSRRSAVRARLGTSSIGGWTRCQDEGIMCISSRCLAPS